MKTYRDNVAMLISNSSGKLLACHRADKRGVWQLPQGGIEAGELPLEAMYRELREEVGICDIEVVGRLPGRIKYDWPKGLMPDSPYCGQSQIYFLLRLADGIAPDLTRCRPAEFDDYKWLNVEEFLTLVDGFKRNAYVRAIGGLIKLYPGYMAESQVVV